jgi:hypothetical protein
MRAGRVAGAGLVFVILLGLAWMASGLQVAEAQGKQGSEAVVVGQKEPVVLVAPQDNGKRIEVLAKIDTGASYSSIDDDLAEALGIDLDSAPKVRVESSLGREKRPLVEVRIQIAGRMLHTRATVNNRSHRSEEVLIGHRDLQGFLVDVSREQLTQPDSPSVPSSVRALIEFPPPPPSPPTLLATLPLAALLVVVMRNLVGVETYGLFAPILLALAFVQIGLPVGLSLFGVMLVAGVLMQLGLRRLHLSRVVRLAVLMAVAAEILLAANAVIDDPQVERTWAAAFPIVVTSSIIEQLWGTWEQEGVRAALKTALWTLVVAVLACPLMVAEPVRSMADHAPFLFGVAVAAAAVLIGRYRGLRLGELVRFRPVAARSDS